MGSWKPGDRIQQRAWRTSRFSVYRQPSFQRRGIDPSIQSQNTSRSDSRGIAPLTNSQGSPTLIASFARSRAVEPSRPRTIFVKNTCVRYDSIPRRSKLAHNTLNDQEAARKGVRSQLLPQSPLSSSHARLFRLHGTVRRSHLVR
jgi:hypothetical protein